jgi:hypothetical protein
MSSSMQLSARGEDPVVKIGESRAANGATTMPSQSYTVISPRLRGKGFGSMIHSREMKMYRDGSGVVGTADVTHPAPKKKVRKFLPR